MPICVAGMHRSGTSLVAKLLHEAGLFLGPESDILPPGEGNTEGHWENVRFIEINDAILELAGGTWDRPPTVETGWQFQLKYDGLFERAIELVRSFQEPWGWKDPRNSLTLPFWQRVIPDVKVVICVRNPLDVAQSLQARNKFPLPTGVTLWADYSSRVAAAAEPARRLVTHYESYFLDFRAEAERLVRFAGLTADAASLGGIVKDELRHNRLPLQQFLDGRIQYDFVRTYLDLCAEAGPVFLRDFETNIFAAVDPSIANDAAIGDRTVWMLGRLAARVVEKQWQLGMQRRELEAAAAVSLAVSRAETNAEKCRADDWQKQAETLREQLTWSRYRWADWLAKWLHKIRGS